jgi:Phytochelatin synthase
MRLTFIAVPLLCSAAAWAQSPAPAGLVPFNAPESAARLERSKHKVDFFPLVNQFESQQNLGYCGPATAVIVLNTLRIDNAAVTKPRDPGLFPAQYRSRLPPGLEPVFSRYTQGTFFDDQTQSVKTRDQFFGGPRGEGKKPSPGLELRELGGILAAHGLAVEVRVVDDKMPDEAARKELVENLRTAGDYAVVNYLRPALGQKGGGHISPLGAYDQPSDSFLVLDVNPNAQRWVWVPAALLVKAMRTKDVAENRGYLLVKEGKPR